MLDAGVSGFKCFMIHSGVDEFPCVQEKDIRTAMEQLQGTNGVFLVSKWAELILDKIII